MKVFTDLLEVSHHLLYQGSHGSNVNDLEDIRIDGAVQVDVFSNLSQDCQQSYVGLTGSLYGSDKKNIYINVRTTR